MSPFGRVSEECDEMEVVFSGPNGSRVEHVARRQLPGRQLMRIGVHENFKGSTSPVS